MRAPLCAALLALVAAGHTRAAEPKWATFADLPVDAEVHAVTISEPFFRGVSPEEISDWQGLVKALRAKGGPGAHVRKLLPEDAEEQVVNEQAEMGKLDGVDPIGVPPAARLALSRLLDEATRTGSFYDEKALAGVELSKAAKELVALGGKRTVYQNELLNREVLAAAFGACVAPTPADFHTARVTVKPGKPVVLVLSCGCQCRWEVNVEKGATVAGVVLFGSGAQELTGTDAPVIYASKMLPNGKPSPAPAASARKQTGREYEQLAAGVKAMTGRDFTTFQGQYKAGDQPFVVKPGAK